MNYSMVIEARELAGWNAESEALSVYQAIADWIRFRGTWLQHVLPETRATFPCVATYSNVLRSVDPTQVTQVLMDLLTRVRAEKRAEGEQVHVVLDGKTLRGTQRHLAEDQKQMHHVTLYDEARTGVVLKEHMVAEKEGKLTQVKEFLTPVFLHRRIISADALYTPKKLLSGGHYGRRALSPLCE